MKTFALTMPSGLFRQLVGHLFRDDHDEHGAVIAAGLAEGPRGPRLLARQLLLAQDGRDYVLGQRGYRMLTADFVRDAALFCRDEQLCYLAVHNHGGSDRVNFSPDDMASHERGYPALVGLLRGRPVGALVLASNAIAGDLFTGDGERLALSHATVVGPSRRILRSSPATPLAAGIQFDRQSRLFGDTGQEILRDLNVGVIGAGGVGSLLIEYLARLGVGNLLVVDPDRLEPSNLPRVIDSDLHDLALRWKWLPGRIRRRLAFAQPTSKVAIAGRVARRANPSCHIQLIHGDFLDASVARQFLHCDYLFLAADSMRCRLLYNAVAHQYLIPGAQIGSKVQLDKATGRLISVFSVVRPVNLDGGCLWCNGFIPPAKLQEEAATEEERVQQRYLDDAAVVAPSVITLNAVGAAYASNEFLFTMLGLRSADAEGLEYFRADSLTGNVLFERPRVGADCPECSVTGLSRRARGDGFPLPMLIKPH